VASLREKLFLLGSETQNKTSEIHRTAFFYFTVVQNVVQIVKRHEGKWNVL